MPLTLPTNPDGSLREFDALEIADMNIQSRGVRDGSNPTHTRRTNASTIRQAFFCDYDQLDNFLIYMLGAAVVYDDSGTDRLSRLMPQSPEGYPEFAFVQLESATGHKIVGDVAGASVDYPTPEYDRWECVLLAEHVPFDLLPDDTTPNERSRYVQTLPTTGEANYQTVPGGIMRYIRNPALPDPTERPHGLPIPFSIGVVVPTANVSRRWVRLPYEAWEEGSTLWNRMNGDPETGAAGLIGTINSSEIFGYPQGSLLMMPPEEQLDRDPLGDGWAWTLTFKWQYRRDHHNWLRWWETDPAEANTNGLYFVGNGTTYYTTDLLPDGVSLFNSADHKTAFQVG
jgi:hypothetical protein